MSEEKEENRKLRAPQVKNEFIEYLKNLCVSVLFGLFTLTAYASDAISVRDIQLLLALEGYELDAKSIDGKLGPVTKAAIRDYRKKKNLPEATNDNELIDNALLDSLSEDTNVRFFSLPKTGQSGTQETGEQDGNDAPVTDVNSKAIDVYAAAIASIYAARHSIEESKEFYERFAWILTAIIGALGAGGWAFLRSQAGEIAERKTKESLAEIESAIGQVSDDLTEHLAGRERFHNETNDFKNEIRRDLEGFLGITTELNKFTYWVIEHGKKSPSDRPPIDAVVNPIFKICEEVLALKPTNKTLLGIIYGTKGIALHLSGKYDAAYKSFLKSLAYKNDKPGTLFNIACSACQLGRYKKAKEYLARAVVLAPETAQQAIDDHDFDPIKDDEGFKAIVGKKA